MSRLAVSFVLSSLVGALALAEEPVDYEIVNRIRDEGLHHSQVMEIAQALTEQIGPRLTGSPQMKQANDWTRDKLREWGLLNAHLESYEHGRGWSFTRSSVSMVAPLASPLLALPKAFTPGTNGPVRGQAMRVEIESQDDFAKYQGKLAGKILFFDKARDVVEPKGVSYVRRGQDDLEELAQYAFAGDGRSDEFRTRFLKRYRLAKPLAAFLTAEKAAAVVEISPRDDGLIDVTGSRAWNRSEEPGVTGLVMASEHYNRVVRMMDAGTPVELEIDVDARFHDEDANAYNTVAEIPGSDLASELVMLGAHLDSWHAGSGATDNGAGSSVVLEAVRILEAIGVRPRRTIRIALWSGEEQGLRGSRAYVAQHFATRPEPTDPEQKDLPSFLRKETGPLTLAPEHAKLSAYFNLDNGSGKIRGIYCQENAAVVPIFESWLAPFKDLGADTVSPQNTGGTDHLSFDAVGLPGFQFIQDGLDYGTKTHHTNIDVYDHLRKNDLMQASVIMASFVYNAAMRDRKMPRKPLPAPPRDDKPTAPTHPPQPMLSK
jgi:carboxypeptidase Q